MLYPILFVCLHVFFAYPFFLTLCNVSVSSEKSENWFLSYCHRTFREKEENRETQEYHALLNRTVKTIRYGHERVELREGGRGELFAA